MLSPISLPDLYISFHPTIHSKKKGKRTGTGIPLLITTAFPLSYFLPSLLMVSWILMTKTKTTTANNLKCRCSLNRGAPRCFFCTELPEAAYCELNSAASSEEDVLPGCSVPWKREMHSHGTLSKASSLDHASLAAKLYSSYRRYEPWIIKDHRKVAFETTVAQNSSSPYYKTKPPV